MRELLQCGYSYHILNRGNNRELMFMNRRDYVLFLSKYKKYIDPFAENTSFLFNSKSLSFSCQDKRS